MDILRKLKNTIEVNNFLSCLFDKIASLPLYRKIINIKIDNYIKKIKENQKYNVIIETTNLCNARCTMCPHTKMKRKMSIMNDEIFDLIIWKIKDEKINPPVFILNGFGEPLTDKKIFERIRKIKLSFPCSIVKFYTNLGLADDGTINSIFQSEIDEINISFNGYDKKNYENTMKIDYDKTYYNLEKLIEEKKGRKSGLKIRISMALVSSNDGDEKDFLKKWLRLVDSVSINKVHNYGNAIEDHSGNYKINYNKQTYPCKYIWNTIVFGVTGDIYACCLDYEGVYNFGNIKEKSILAIFYSDKFRNFRSIHLKNGLKHIKMCEKCYTPYKNGVEWLVDELY